MFKGISKETEVYKKALNASMEVWYSKPNERSDDIDKVLPLFKTIAIDILANFADIGTCVGGEQCFTTVKDERV